MSQADTTSPHPSELELHTFALGELAGQKGEHVRAHQATCARCREAVAALGEAHADFKRVVLPRTLADLEGRVAGGRRRVLRWLWLVAPTAAACLLLLRLAGRDIAGPGPDVSPKGGELVEPSLDIFGHRGGEVFRVVADATRLRAGDEIRFVVHHPEALGYVMIVSADGAGQASLYVPHGGQRSAPIPGAGPRAELPGSIVLDASPGPERVYALFSRQPLAWSAVQPALVALARSGAAGLRLGEPLAVPADAQVSLLFDKENRP